MDCFFSIVDFHPIIVDFCLEEEADEFGTEFNSIQGSLFEHI